MVRVDVKQIVLLSRPKNVLSLFKRNWKHKGPHPLPFTSHLQIPTVITFRTGTGTEHRHTFRWCTGRVGSPVSPRHLVLDGLPHTGFSPCLAQSPGLRIVNRSQEPSLIKLKLRNEGVTVRSTKIERYTPDVRSVLSPFVEENDRPYVYRRDSVRYPRCGSTSVPSVPSAPLCR